MSVPVKLLQNSNKEFIAHFYWCDACGFYDTIVPFEASLTLSFL